MDGMDEKMEMTPARAALGKIQEAETVRDELWAALHGAGITLPSLRVEPLAYSDERPRPLLELGRCTLRTARQITVALQKGRRP
jgi:hypothetical protein